MRAGIYNPYLDTLGGGERYTMAVATTLVEKNYKVEVEWPDSSIKSKLQDRFGIDLTDIQFVDDIKRGDAYDLCFWLSDGSIPLLKARKNFLHFQVPFQKVGGLTLFNKMKLFRIDKVICNSFFTKQFIDKEFGVESVVVYPPIDTKKIKPLKKENLILSIGRFSQLLQSKRQDILIEIFKKLYDGGFKDWKLVLAGGTEVGVGGYLESLKKSSQGYPVRIIERPSFETVLNLYGRAKIFWSASGYGVDERTEPMKVEHFGITVVESMAAGCVPVVYAAGGHKETVSGESGFLWKDKGKLQEISSQLMTDDGLLKKISINAQKQSQTFGYDKFTKNFSSLL